jgi:hypothetical protein
LIYQYECNIPEPDAQDMALYNRSCGERLALKAIRELLGDASEQGAMRDRKEVEERLTNLVGLLAHSDLTEDSTVRAHARALDLVWVLHPGLLFNEQRAHLDGLIQARREGDQP